jgi:hypothetical protein
MERVAFLIEETNERISCLLNPETLVLRRLAGVRPRRSVSGGLTGVGLADDPLLFTGGGQTELELELLFDVTIAGSSLDANDVRDLTGPLWNLAENAGREDSYGRLQPVRFVWGKWNMPGVVVAVAERLDYFTSEGVPRRSWLRMRFRRVVEQRERLDTNKPGASADQARDMAAEMEEAVSSGGALVRTHEITGGSSDPEDSPGERLEEIAERQYGDASLWRMLALFNGIADPLTIAAGTVLRIPSPRGQENTP